MHRLGYCCLKGHLSVVLALVYDGVRWWHMRWYKIVSRSRVSGVGRGRCRPLSFFNVNNGFKRPRFLLPQQVEDGGFSSPLVFLEEVELAYFILAIELLTVCDESAEPLLLRLLHADVVNDDVGVNEV